MSSPTTELSSFPMPEMADMPAPVFSPPVTTIPRPNDRPLRSSCGQCNQAKVKCSKDRPTCRRCATRGTPCVYSISLRGIKRPRAGKQMEPPKPSKKGTPPSPVLSDSVKSTTVDIPPQLSCFSDLNTELYPGEFGNDLDNIFMNPFDVPLPDPSFSFSMDLPTQDIPIEPMVQQMPFPSTMPLSPITPPGSRDGYFENMQIQPLPTPPPSCCCHQSISFKLTELTLPKPLKHFVLEDFLTDHRANMALCTTVLDCTDPQHMSGLPLLIQIIALLVHMTSSFDQIPQANQGDLTQYSQHPLPVTPPTPTTPSGRKEQVTQANTLRTELAKLSALIQEFDRRYCSLDHTSVGDDTYLLWPLFGNLQWKTQAKFDAVRSWMPWL